VLEHLAEVAECVGADHVAVVVAVDRAAVVVADHDVEVVVPERGGDLEQLAPGEHRAYQCLALHFPARAHAHRVLDLAAHVLGPRLRKGLAEGVVSGVRQARGDGSVVDGGRIELAVDPRCQARHVAAAQAIELGDRFGRGAIAHVVEHAHGEGWSWQGEQAPGRGLFHSGRGAGRGGRRSVRYFFGQALEARCPRKPVTLAVRALQRGALPAGEASIHDISLLIPCAGEYRGKPPRAVTGHTFPFRAGAYVQAASPRLIPARSRRTHR